MFDWSIILATGELHNSIFHIKHRQHVLQKDVAENVWATTTTGDGGHAQPSQRIPKSAQHQVLRIEPKLGIIDDNGDPGRHGVARGEVAAEHEVVHGWRLESIVDSV